MVPHDADCTIAVRPTAIVLGGQRVTCRNLSLRTHAPGNCAAAGRRLFEASEYVPL